MKQLLPDAAIRRQWWTYGAALLLLLAAALYPPVFSIPAALALGASGAWLGFNPVSYTHLDVYKRQALSAVRHLAPLPLTLRNHGG